MNVLETEWWTLAVPPEWWADAEEESILVGDRDDVGCIEITTLHRDNGVFDEAEIERIAAADREPVPDWEEVTLGDFSGLHCSYMEEWASIREWYLAHESMLLFVTYSCAHDNRGMDDAAVDELLDTLQVLPRETPGDGL